MYFDTAIEAGNKVLVNVGLFQAYGKEVTTRMTRLLETVEKDATSIKVAKDLDW